MLRNAYRAAALALFLVTTILLTSAFRPAPENPFTDDMDRSVNPGDDFYRYANGGWLKTAAFRRARRPSTRGLSWLPGRVKQVRSMIQDAASAQSAKGSTAQKPAILRDFMDQTRSKPKA
jgi:putative endopeptidase